MAFVLLSQLVSIKLAELLIPDLPIWLRPQDSGQQCNRLTVRTEGRTRLGHKSGLGLERSRRQADHSTEGEIIQSPSSASLRGRFFCFFVYINIHIIDVTKTTSQAVAL